MLPENLEFAYPWVVWLLPLPFLIYWLLPGIRLKSASLILPIFNNAIKYTGQKPRTAALIRSRNFFSWLVLLLGWAGVLLALSSPRLIGEPEYEVKTVRDFLVTADISFSMAQQDWTIDGKKARRWDAVKQVMKEFIKKRDGDRMGLIFFGSSAYIQAPFTPDLETVGELLEEADVGMAGQMTHIGKAITKGIELFDRDTIETKVMLLLTDGVDAGTDILPLDAADLARKDSVIIYTIGIGDPGGRSGGDLDQRTLTEIAEMTGGQYFLAQDEQRLNQIYQELDKLEPIEYQEKQNRPVTLLYYYPLGAVLGLLITVLLLMQLYHLIKRLFGKEVSYAG